MKRKRDLPPNLLSQIKREFWSFHILNLTEWGDIMVDVGLVSKRTLVGFLISKQMLGVFQDFTPFKNNGEGCSISQNT